MEAIHVVKHAMSQIGDGTGPCPACGLRFVRNSASDRGRHRRYHDETLHGVKNKALGRG
jgi:hypothetical protein